jgi:dTDP-4-amino-4,6-dideoxygalactose transaminase
MPAAKTDLKQPRDSMVNMNVPFLELKREAQRLSMEFQEAFTRVNQRGWYILGPELEMLEQEFSAFLDVPYAVGVASGTDAITVALESTGVIRPGEGDEVVTTALSAAFTALAICQAGAIPRFADIDPRTLQLDPEKLESLINKKTRAIVPVHLYGHSCNMKRILQIAEKYGLVIIEDACQAHGSIQDGHRLGTLGHAAAFSFYPTKNLGAWGDAGSIVTREKYIYGRARILRNGGQTRTYHHELLGRNSRLDEIQASILRFKLKRLDAGNERRRSIAAQYDKALAQTGLQLLPAIPGLVPNRHLYPVRTPRRDELREHLRREGVETLIHYPVPLPRQPALKDFVIPGQEFPVAETAARELLSLPLYPDLTEEEIQYIIGSVCNFSE